jgi:hypothetical protein
MTRYILAAAVAAALVCSGCGTSQDPTGPRKVFVEWDATGTINTVPGYREEVIRAVERFAVKRDEVFAAVIDGQPITTANIKSQSFALHAPGSEGGEIPGGIEAIGAGFAHDFVAGFGTPETVLGSGQLQGLQIAANTPGVSEIYMWTDAIVNEAGFNLSIATPAEIKTEIAYWKPKLANLANKTVLLLGVGRGVHHATTVERAHYLFAALLQDDHGHLEWLQTLAQR